MAGPSLSLPAWFRDPAPLSDTGAILPAWIVLTALAWLSLIAATVLVLRAILSDPLDDQDDPSEDRPDD